MKYGRGPRQVLDLLHQSQKIPRVVILIDFRTNPTSTVAKRVKDGGVRDVADLQTIRMEARRPFALLPVEEIRRVHRTHGIER